MIAIASTAQSGFSCNSSLLPRHTPTFPAFTSFAAVNGILDMNISASEPCCPRRIDTISVSGWLILFITRHYVRQQDFSHRTQTIATADRTCRAALRPSLPLQFNSCSLTTLYFVSETSCQYLDITYSITLQELHLLPPTNYYADPEPLRKAD